MPYYWCGDRKHKRQAGFLGTMPFFFLQSALPALKWLSNNAARLTDPDVIGRSLPAATLFRASKSRRRDRAIPSTDCPALSAAPLAPLLLTGEAAGVAVVRSTQPSCTTAISACSEYPWMITFVMSNVSRERRLAAARSSVFCRLGAQEGLRPLACTPCRWPTRTVIRGALSPVLGKQWSHWISGAPSSTCDLDSRPFCCIVATGVEVEVRVHRRRYCLPPLLLCAL